MIPILILTLTLTLISFIANRKKTVKGVKKGAKQFLAILPTLMSVIILISVVLFFVSDELLMEYMGEKAGWGAYFSAALIGSVSILPGFIAYPLSGILVQTGVSLSVIAVFITTLKMVGILTIPIERRYFGLKIAILRNTLSFIGAIIVGAIMALILNFI
jgi:uncharacterized membrane protein YraQ (UPF0718 family)